MLNKTSYKEAVTSDEQTCFVQSMIKNFRLLLVLSALAILVGQAHAQESNIDFSAECVSAFLDDYMQQLTIDQTTQTSLSNPAKVQLLSYEKEGKSGYITMRYEYPFNPKNR